jgi:acylphosphatase
LSSIALNTDESSISKENHPPHPNNDAIIADFVTLPNQKYHFYFRETLQRNFLPYEGYPESPDYAMMETMSQSNLQHIIELHAIVRGYVQGVGFRYFVIHQAQHLGLRGYTRNLSNGDVEVVAQGPRVVLERLLHALQKGPSAAQVDEVQATWHEPSEPFSGFRIRY